MILVARYAKGRNPLITDLRADIDVESDGDTPGIKDELLYAEEEKEEETRVALIKGSFSTCVQSTIPYLLRKK